MKKLLTFAAAAATAFSLAATDVNFTYNVDNKPSKCYGFEKKEVYDVAIRITDPALTGAKVKGLSVIVPVETDAATDLSAWLTTGLQLKDDVNSPDLASTPATLSANLLTATFETPVEIPAEGIWVGYTMKITDLTGEGYPNFPVAVIESKQNLDNGLWMHTSRSRLKWVNMAESIKAVSTMTVHLETSFGPNDAAAVIPAKSFFKTGSEGSIPLTIVNHGTWPLNTIEYTYSFNGKSTPGKLTLSEPVLPGGKTATVDIPVVAGDVAGEFDLTVSINKCNGNDNTDPMRTSEGYIYVWDTLPVGRPLVEEYTGLRCGYCPRGYVAMEEMPKLFGDRFIGLAYHSEDYETGEMVVMPNTDFPIKVPGFPFGSINRAATMDPGSFPQRWPEFANEITPAEVDVTLDWANEGKTEVTARTTLTFAGDISNTDYRIAVALVADGLKNEKWLQSNNFSGQTTAPGIESDLWDIFLKGPKKVSGLTFNDVVVYFKDVRGIEGSVPRNLKAGQQVTLDYHINMGEVLNVEKEVFINPGATVHAVGILLDAATGQALNCNKSNELTPDYTGIDEVLATGAVAVATTYHDLSGARISAPGAGVCIERVTYTDGSVRTRKIIR